MHRILLVVAVAACHHTSPAPVPAPVANEASPDAAPACPDAVACLLMADPPACCPRQEGMGPDPVPEVTPEERDRDMILAGVAQVKERAWACGAQFPQASGIVKLSVTVAPEGTVTSVVVRQAPDAGLGACVAAAMQTAHFAPSIQPTVFAYPFRF